MTLFPSLLRNQNLCNVLARYPECLLSRASSRKAGVRHVCVCVSVRVRECALLTHVTGGFAAAVPQHFAESSQA